MATSIKAQVAQISAGTRAFTGLLGENGNFYVAVPQVCDLFLIDSNQASRTIKTLMGKDFQFDKGLTKLHPKAVNIIALRDFELLVKHLDRAGSALAQDFRDDLVGLSLHQLACDAFGIECNKEERQAWLLVRMQSRALFWELSRAVQSWMQSRACSAPEFTYYSNTYDALNKRLFGMTSKEIKEELGLTKDSALCREHFGQHSLRHVNQVQELAAKLMARDQVLKPINAVKLAADANLLDVADFRI